MRLSTERYLGYGVVGPIRWSAIDQWCERHGYDPDVTELFCSVIALVDHETMQRQRKPG